VCSINDHKIAYTNEVFYLVIIYLHKGATLMKLQLGLEEEYFLIDKDTKKLITQHPAGLWSACEEIFGEHLSSELFTCQLELSSIKCSSISQLADEQRNTRGKLRRVLNEFNLQFVSASSYPSGMLDKVELVEDAFHLQVIERFSAIGRQLLVNGLHMHVECRSDNKRVEILKKLPCFLPIFVALSSSSAFFQNEDTGLQSYRTFLFEGMPISGMPKGFNTLEEYDALMDDFFNIGFINDAGNIYWHVRLGNHLPTIETRVSDSCPRVQDSVALTSLLSSLILTLVEQEPTQEALPFYTQNAAYIDYYLWQTRRYSAKKVNFFDFNHKEKLPLAQALDHLLTFVMPVAKKLNCVEQLEQLTNIVEQGSSSDRQRAAYFKNKSIDDVCELLIKETNTL
jgi:glutamate---cysteine ligase / carboxylate-amine ligase